MAAYASAPRAAFVNWDDPNHVYENPRVVGPDWFRRSWSDRDPPGVYPVLYALYRAEWVAGRHQPWLFHLDNVLLHAGNAVLVGTLAAGLGMPPTASWLAAALWALHPAHVESVAWITERKNVLYAFFWLGSLLLYVRGRRTGSRRAPLAYAGSLLLFVLSLLSKGAAITLPAAFVLVEWACRRRLDRRFWLGLVPFVVLGIVGGVGLVRNVPATMLVPALGDRLLIACRGFWRYVAILVWPHPLLPVYPRWSVTPADPVNLLSALGVAGLAAIVWVARRRLPRLVLLGGGLFATNIVLVLGLVWNSYMGVAWIADRYLYLPAVGVVLATVAGLAELAPAAKLSPRFPVVVLGLWCAVLGLATWRQVPLWRDSETLWTYTVAHDPDCLSCQDNLALTLAGRGDLAGAARHYEAALRLEVHEQAALGLCSVRLRQRQVEEAASLCELALRLDPASAVAHRMLGVVRADQHRLGEAAEQYGYALRLALDAGTIAGGLPGLIDDFAGVLLAEGRVGDAIRVLADGMARQPDAAVLPISLAWIRATNSDPAWRDGVEAVRLAERACALTGNRDVDALDALAAAYAEAGRFAEAAGTARRALAMTENPRRADQIRARVGLYEAHRPYRE